MAWGSFSTGGGGGGADTPTTAANVTYDNSTSKIDAGNVQEALDFVAGLTLPRLTVTIDAGSQVTISKGDTSISLTSTGSDLVYLSSTGTWTVSASLDDQSTSESVECNGYQDYSVELSYVSDVLNDNSWEVIKRVADADEGANYWSVGDTKSIVLNGKIGNLQANNLTVDVFILGFNHNAAKEGAHLIHFGLGKIGGKMIALCDSNYNSYVGSGFCMNTSETNSGGWKASHMRKNVLGNSGTPSSPPANSLLAALPADLLAVMQPVNKYTDNTGNASNSSGAVTATVDYLFALGEFEVYASRTYANQYERNSQQQYDYFKAGNPKTFGKHNATGTVVWAWSRSPNYGNYYRFVIFYTDGTAYSYIAGSSGGLFAGFAV